MLTEGSEEAVLASTCGLPIGHHASTRAGAHLTIDVAWANELTGLAVTTLLACASRRTEFIEATATESRTDLALDHRTGLVASSTLEAVLAFTRGGLAILGGGAFTVVGAGDTASRAGALELTFVSLSSGRALASRTLDRIHVALTDLDATTGLVVVHGALLVATDSDPSSVGFTLAARVLLPRGSSHEVTLAMAVADPRHGPLSLTLYIAVLPEPSRHALAVLHVLRARAGAHIGASGLCESSESIEVSSAALPAPRSLITFVSTDPQEGVPVGDILSGCAVGEAKRRQRGAMLGGGSSSPEELK